MKIDRRFLVVQFGLMAREGSNTQKVRMQATMEV